MKYLLPILFLFASCSVTNSSPELFEVDLKHIETIQGSPQIFVFEITSIPFRSQRTEFYGFEIAEHYPGPFQKGIYYRATMSNKSDKFILHDFEYVFGSIR